MTESAFETACPGSGLPKTTQSRTAHGANTSEAHDRDHADQPEPLRERRAGRRHASQAQTSASHSGLVAGQRGRAQQQAHRQQARVQEARAPRVAQDAGHQQARAQRQDPEQDRGVRLDGVEEQRQVDGGREAGPDRQRPRPARPAARAPRPRPRRGARPARDRSAPSQHRTPWRARIAVSSGIGAAAPESAIGIATSSDGSGSQTSNAGRGNTSGGVP